MKKIIAIILISLFLVAGVCNEDVEVVPHGAPTHDHETMHG